MATTTRIRMPLLSPGQAQKEISHNEALVLLDSVVHGCCGGGPSNIPPQQPSLGMAYICGEAPSGDWGGHAGELASWTSGGWRFTPVFDGLQITDRTDGCTRRYLNGQWSIGRIDAKEVRVSGLKVVGSRCPGIAGASGGATVDTEARSALSEVLAALRAHGLIAP